MGQKTLHVDADVVEPLPLSSVLDEWFTANAGTR